jgi:bifunctional pyridoxal-dependent enzyme with beta-cystathionase and maltose regulon repressor activities
MRRDAKEWSFPSDQIDLLMAHKPQSKAIWITNPIYCTGVRQSFALLPYVRSLLKQGVAVIIDECLCAPPHSLARQLYGKRFLGISSPHKTVCINALKFSTLVFDECHEHFFGSLSDILIGGLGASNYTAIQHFCSSNFMHVQSIFLSYIDDARASISQIAQRYKPFIDFDKETTGHYMTFYAPGIKGDNGTDPHFLEELVYATGTSIIPGTINQFNPDSELCFRVNLARSSTQLYGAFSRVLQYLANKS